MDTDHHHDNPKQEERETRTPPQKTRRAKLLSKSEGGFYFAEIGGVEAEERMASAISRLMVASARLCAATIVS